MSTALSTTDHEPLVSNPKNKYGRFTKRKKMMLALVAAIALLLVVIIAVSIQGAESKSPFNPTDAAKKHKMLYEFQWAPFTPTNDDYTLASVPTINYDAIPSLAATGDRFGADTILLGGTNAQFETMTVAERKQLLAAWVNDTVANNYGFKIIFQVLSTQLSEAIELAQYAAELNAKYGLPQAIASLPTFWERPKTSDDFEQLISRWLRPIADAAPGLELWYVHEPSQTRVVFDMKDFVNVAYNGNEQGTLLRELKGAKYLKSDANDVFKTTNEFFDDLNGGIYGGFDLVIWSQPDIAWIGYSKVAGFGSDYYNIPVRKCMLKAAEAKNYDKVYRLQQWKQEMEALMGDKVQRRCLHQRISGFDMGPARQPELPLEDEMCEDILQQLDEVNYFGALEQQIIICA